MEIALGLEFRISFYGRIIIPFFHQKIPVVIARFKVIFKSVKDNLSNFGRSLKLKAILSQNQLVVKPPKNDHGCNFYILKESVKLKPALISAGFFCNFIQMD